MSASRITHPQFQQAVTDWAQENKLDTHHADFLEEMLLRLLGVNLDETPPFFCRWTKLTDDSLQFTILFSPENMARLGGLATFQEMILNELKARSRGLQAKIIVPFSLEKSWIHPSEVGEQPYEALALSLNTQATHDILLPEIKRRLAANPALIAHYQRYSFATAQIQHFYQVQCEVAQLEQQQDDKIRELTVRATTQPGAALQTLLTEAKLQTTDPDFANQFKTLLKTRRMTLESEAFQTLLADEKMSPAITITKTMNRAELFAVINMALLLHLNHQQRTRDASLASAASLIAPATVIPKGKFQIHAGTPLDHQPVTRLTVSANLADDVITLLNRSETKTAQRLPTLNGSPQEPTVDLQVENRQLVDYRLLRDIRQSLRLFPNRLFAQKQVTLNPVCSQLFLVCKRLTDNSLFRTDMQHYAGHGDVQVQRVDHLIHLLKLSTTHPHFDARLWLLGESIQRCNQLITAEQGDLHFKPEYAAEAKTGQQRIAGYLQVLQAPLTELLTQYTEATLATVPATQQRFIRELITLQTHLRCSAFHRLSLNDVLRRQIEIMDATLENLIHALLIDPYRELATVEHYADQIAQAVAKTEQQIVILVNHALENPDGLRGRVPPENQFFYQDPQLVGTLLGYDALLTQLSQLKERIHTVLDNVAAEPDANLQETFQSLYALR